MKTDKQYYVECDPKEELPEESKMVIIVDQDNTLVDLAWQLDGQWFAGFYPSDDLSEAKIPEPEKWLKPITILTEEEILDVLVEHTHDSPGARRAAHAITNLFRKEG